MIIGNALLVILALDGWFIDLVYALPGFPSPDIALSDEERRRLAADGMAAIRPIGPGVELLREARLSGGGAAFTSREVLHMQDVREVVTGFAIAWLVGLVALVGAWVYRERLGGGDGVRFALRAGAVALAAVIAVAGLALLIAFEPIFEGFHAIFFAGDSWRFRSDDTLLQLYPEMFWGAAGTILVLLVIIQCLLLAAMLRQPRARRRPVRP